MQTALRKMGNSTGLIVPRALLAEIGVTTGAAMDLRVEVGRLVATPLPAGPRAGWAADPAVLGDPSPEEREWLDAPLTQDADWHGEW